LRAAFPHVNDLVNLYLYVRQIEVLNKTAALDNFTNVDVHGLPPGTQLVHSPTALVFQPIIEEEYWLKMSYLTLIGYLHTILKIADSPLCSELTMLLAHYLVYLKDHQLRNFEIYLTDQIFTSSKDLFIDLLREYQKPEWRTSSLPRILFRYLAKMRPEILENLDDLWYDLIH